MSAISFVFLNDPLVVRVFDIPASTLSKFFKVVTPTFAVERNEDPTVAMGDGGGVWAPGDAWGSSSFIDAENKKNDFLGDTWDQMGKY